MKKIVLIFIIIFLVGCHDETRTPIAEAVPITVESKTIDSEISDAEPSEVDPVEEVDESEKIMVDVDVLNLREEPSVSSEKLGSVYKTSVYEVLATKVIMNGEKEETWYRVHVGKETEGWIAGWFCEATDEEPNDLAIVEAPSIKLHQMYKTGETINKEDMVTSRYTIEVLIDDVIVEESFTFNTVGKYEVEVTTYDELLRELSKETFDIEVYKNILGFGYLKPNETRTAVIESRTSYQLDMSSLYIDFNHVIWCKAKLDGQILYVNTDDLEIEHFYEVQNIEMPFTKYGGLTLGLKSATLNKGMMNDGFIWILDLGTMIVNLESGALIELEDSVEILPQDRLIVNYSSYQDYSMSRKSKKSLFQVIKMTEDDFEVVYKNSGDYIGFETIELGADKIVAEGYYDSKDHWQYAPENRKVDTLNLTSADGSWFCLTTGNDTLHVGYPEEIVVHTSMDELSEKIGVYTPEDLLETQYLATYDIIDGKTVMWFEVTLSDSLTGYAYRTWRDDESRSVLCDKNITFILDDGKRKVIESENKFFYIPLNISDALSSLGLYTTYIWFDERVINVFDRKDGRELEVPFNSQIELSPDKTKVLATTWHYGEPITTIRIYNIENKVLEEIYMYNFVRTNAFEFKWIDDQTIAFVKGTSEGKFDETITYKDGQWIVSTDE
ncbi:MAG: SH3 domain-containing protein [Clostridiales bacterium]|nr:SH3 domain-containing protein [Clostridiales bacterium]